MSNDFIYHIDTIYTNKQLEILEEVCIEHAVFAFVEEYDKVEYDFICWLSENNVSFRWLDNLYPYIDRYCKELAQDLDAHASKC